MHRFAVITAAALLIPAAASAQTIEGFVTAGTHRDVNREQFPGFGGGMLFTTTWIGVGAQGDAFLSPPYMAGRFTPFVEAHPFVVAGIRPFVQAGKGFGEFHGRMYGMGMDFRPRNGRVGVRASYQMYLAEMWPGREKRVQPSVTFGIIWTAARGEPWVN